MPIGSQHIGLFAFDRCHVSVILQIMSTTSLPCLLLLMMPLADSQQFRLNMTSAMPSFISEKAGRKPVITVLTTITQDSSTYPIGPCTSEAIQFGIEKLRRLPNLLANYEIAFELMDDKCSNVDAIRELTVHLEQNDQAKNRFPLAFLSECSDVGQLVSASMIEQYNFIGIVTSMNIFQLFLDRPKHPNYYGQFLRPDIYYLALVGFLKRFNWTRVAIISELEQYSNVMDGYLVNLLDSANISVIYMAKLTLESKDEDEMSSNFEILKERDARIIISQAVSSFNIACWLHRYGLYGTNHVIFEFAWNAIDEISDADIPDYLPWCTAKMVLEVQKSKFTYADATMDKVLGPATVDIIGINSQQVSSYLVGEINGANVFRSSVNYWSPYYYDHAIYTALLLNTTETLLNQRNQTLLDWVTTSENFRRNGQEIVSILKEAISSVKVTGLKGYYEFADQQNGNRPTGYLPIAFSQVSVTENGTISDKVVAYYKSNENGVIFVDRVQWRTKDGQPPKGILTYANLQLSVFPNEGVQYFLQVVAAICASVLFASLASFAVALCRRKHLPDPVIFLLSLGNLAMLAHIFLMPNVESAGDGMCGSAACLIALGYSLTLAAATERLRHACKRTICDPSGRNSASTNAIASRLKQFKVWFVAHRPLYASITWLVLILLLIVTAYVSASVPLVLEETYYLPPVNSETDQGLAYRPYHFGCSFSSTLFTDGAYVSSIFLSLLFLTETYLLLTGAMSVYGLYLARQRFKMGTVLTQLTKCFCCKILTMVGGAFAAGVSATNGQSLLVVTSAFVTSLVVIDIVLVVVPQMKPDVRCEPELLALQTSQVSKTPMALRKSPIVNCLANADRHESAASEVSKPSTAARNTCTRPSNRLS